MLALDYTKAFDSVEFGFIHKTFEAFNFGEQFRHWIKVIYKGGESCIANNGYLSSKFPIERSTRQGDPISPLVFILVLELLFICIRNDENIRGIRIMNNEVKLTSYADDATYFLKDKTAAECLLCVIARFSKVSGLEINKTKSECLILDFEMGLDSNDSKFCEIPIVENLKILGHFFGKNRLICEYQNYYSKLSKYDKITAVWKQRELTIFGRNLLINSLLNSLFLFNSQVEAPPRDFIRILETKNKSFLWNGGVAKIAHHSLIGSFMQGGINYKDIEATLESLNFKYIQRLLDQKITNSNCLPKYWLMKLFKIPIKYEFNDDQYFKEYFESHLNILDCNLDIPKRVRWLGHPFYYDALVTYAKILKNRPKTFESLVSAPLWFNKMLGTTFDVKLSKAGYNYVSDIIRREQNVPRLSPSEIMNKNKVTVLKNKLDPHIRKMIVKNMDKTVIIYPFQVINDKNVDKLIRNMGTKQIYELLISEKVRMPKGLLNWCMELELSDEQIKTALSFAYQSSHSVRDWVFQYKITANILPTNEYLYRYKIKDSNICELCGVEIDTVVHRLYECEIIRRLVEIILEILQSECKQPYICMIEYLFGKTGNTYLALNHVVLELKKFIHFSRADVPDPINFKDQFINKVRSLIIKEKSIFYRRGKYEKFEEKWADFIYIYDFRGPDCIGLVS